MTALSLETAKTIAIVVALVFVAFAVISAWVIKTLVTKVIVIVLMAGLALGVWTQRATLQDCATKAKEKASALDASGLTCTFFGTDVEISGD
jgi:protein-S-isoprenylcysteine O-methyltransferase Ste14